MCSIEGCKNNIYCKQKCRKCYYKEYRNTPEQVEKRKDYHKKHYQENRDWYTYRNRNLSLEERKNLYKLTSEWGKRNRKRRSENSKKLYYKNIEHSRKMGKVRSGKRRANILKAIPKWADYNKMVEIYKNCPKGMEVDHIIPLKSEFVCGLHVEYNLQYLTREENARKYNKVEGL